MANGKPVLAAPASPDVAQCPACGGEVRKRTGGRTTWFAVLLALAGASILTLAACQPTPGASPGGDIAIPGGGDITVPAPDEGPTVEHPTVRLVITVKDGETEQPVRATISVDSTTVRDSDRMEVVVSGEVTHDFSQGSRPSVLGGRGRAPRGPQ